MALRQTSPHPRRRRLHPRRHPRRRRPIRHGLRLHRLPPPPCVGARITSTVSRPPRWPPRCASSGSRRASCVGPRPTTLGRGSATKICSRAMSAMAPRRAPTLQASGQRASAPRSRPRASAASGALRSSAAARAALAPSAEGCCVGVRGGLQQISRLILLEEQEA